MKLVLFDCDGTLVDSAGLIHEVMYRTFVQFGHEPPALGDTKSIIGLTLDIAIARLFGRAHADGECVEMMAYYKSIYADVRRESGAIDRLFDGIDAAIADLAVREDVIIGAVTGKSRRGLDLILDSHDWRDHFKVSRTADDCPSKPHPAMVNECCEEAGIAPADTVVVGDAIYDMEMAKAAGATAIGVSWGYASTDALWQAGADAVVDQAAYLTTYIHKG